MGAGRSDSLTVGIKNRDLITVVALAVKYEFVLAIAMRAGCHSSFCQTVLIAIVIVVTVHRILWTVAKVHRRRLIRYSLDDECNNDHPAVMRSSILLATSSCAASKRPEAGKLVAASQAC